MSRLTKIIQRSAEIDNPLIFATEAEDVAASMEGKNENVNRNFFYLWLIVSFVLLVIIGRVFFLQTVRSGYYREVAENNRIRSLVIKAPRGIIRDKHGDTLARNIPSFDAAFVPAELPDQLPERKSLFEKLSSIIEMDPTEIESLVENCDKESRERFLLKANIGEDAALIVEERYSTLKGIYIEKSARRDYVDGTTFSPIIGYDGKITKEELLANPHYLMTDYIGKNGLEYMYERQLHGKHGEYRMEVNSNGEIKESLGVINPIPGNELLLNVDAGLQRKVHEVLSRILEENKEATGAVAVAVNPQDGGILALVNVPTYDNNLFAEGISSEAYSQLVNDHRRPMTNRAISGEYPPGSTFKPMVAAASLEQGIITENTRVDCHGNISVGSWNFPDWSTHGSTDVKKAIAESCDVFFYAVGGGWDHISGLGIDNLARYVELFGLGKPMGIDLPSEARGIVPTKEWKFKRFSEKWYIGDDYHCSIGQGFVTATPLQIAVSTSVIANGGTLYKPQIVDKIIHSETRQEEDIPPEIIRQGFISANNIRIVREGMRQTVTDGSGRSLNDLKVVTAGKTGTAQFGAEEKTHSWYISFGPYENPQMAMVVLVEGGGEGHDWAVPATKEIYKWYFDQERGTKMEEEEKTNKENIINHPVMETQ